MDEVRAVLPIVVEEPVKALRSDGTSEIVELATALMLSPGRTSESQSESSSLCRIFLPR
jgi:hypothetical protein